MCVAADCIDCTRSSEYFVQLFEAWTWLVSMRACVRLLVTSQLSRATAGLLWWVFGTLALFQPKLWLCWLDGYIIWHHNFFEIRCYVLKLLFTWVVCIMLCLAQAQLTTQVRLTTHWMHSTPRSRKDEVVWFKNWMSKTILFVRKVIGACLYLQSTWLFSLVLLAFFWISMSIAFDTSAIRKNSRTRLFETLFNMDEP